MEIWDKFKGTTWKNEINVRDFIQNNYKFYEGNEDFLVGTTDKTNKVWNKCSDLLKEELKKGVLDIDVSHVAGINAFDPGYIDKDNEVIVGLQTDAPLKRMVNPFGGMRMVYNSLKAYNYKLSPKVEDEFKYRKTHNEGVFDAYTGEIRKARHAGLLTGLPDAYGRGRIIGDYRRIALYGIDYLMEQKKKEWDAPVKCDMSEDIIRTREELSMQYRALQEIKDMALSYGYDISKPAKEF